MVNSGFLRRPRTNLEHDMLDSFFSPLDQFHGIAFFPNEGDSEPGSASCKVDPSKSAAPGSGSEDCLKMRVCER